MKDRFLTNSRYRFPPSEDITVPSLGQLYWSFAGSNLISSAIMSNFRRDEDRYRGLFSSLTAQWLSCDHTYKSVANIGYRRACDGKWFQQYTALFVIVNERGQSLQWKFTKTEKFSEVSNAFLQLANRFKEQGLKQLKGIYTDTCRKWASTWVSNKPKLTVE